MDELKIIIDGKTVELPGGGGGGGNPVGTVISFLGTSAPQGYLVCDGAEYEISAYPALAEFFLQQFGASNHFGGDGTTTFAVPDMRNLFLRGYHGAKEEQLSGEVGERQEATGSPFIFIDTRTNPGITGLCGDNTSTLPIHTDSLSSDAVPSRWTQQGFKTDTNWKSSSYYTSRPVNMAVLYCIKAN